MDENEDNERVRARAAFERFKETLGVEVVQPKPPRRPNLNEVLWEVLLGKNKGPDAR